MIEPPFLDPPPTPRAVTGPPSPGPVLVLAPHPDDETAGPGGTLRLHVRRGDAVKVIFLTTGVAASRQGTLDPEGYRQLREQEARRAARVLGVTELEFWRLPDGARARREDLDLVVPRIAEAITTSGAATVYAPRSDEIHRDHHVTALAAREACRQAASAPRLFGYEVWTAGLPRWVVDTSEVHADKVRACQCYASQLEHTDIIRAFTGLNTYRAILLPGGAQFGEAFDEYQVS